MNEKLILAACSCESQKYWFNPIYADLPFDIQKKIKTIMVLFTEEIGGVFILSFMENGDLSLQSMAGDDGNYDEIGAKLKIDQLQQKEEKLWEQLSQYYQLLKRGDHVTGC